MSTNTTPQVQKAVAELSDLHAQLVSETLRVEKALEALGSLTAPAGAGKGAGKPRRGPRAARKRRGGGRQRSPQTVALEGEVIEAVSLAPGLKVSEIAQRIEADPQPLYTIAARLAKEGRVRKDGQCFYPAAQSGD